MSQRRDERPERQTGEARISRRTLIGAAGGFVAVGLIKTQAEALNTLLQLEARTTSAQDPTKVMGRPPTETGSRSPAERPQRYVDRPLPSGWSMTPLQDLQGIITPADLHFERHHAGIPEIDPRTYSLLIHGMVERPMKFTLEDLRRFPTVSQICFIECSGNGSQAFKTRRSTRRDMSPQYLDGLTSTSEWIGVPLATLFREVGVRTEAKWFLAESTDAAMMTRSIPIEKAWEDAMIAYGQNGEPIRPEQGYPARLMLPGWEGNAQIKWIRRIELSDRPFMSREETSKYTDPLPNQTARQFSFIMDAKSTITFPAYPYALPETGWWEVRGLAWSGRGRITSVDVSVDRGRTWVPAELQEPVLPKCHTRFRALWNWDGRETFLMSRATDETGYTQPSLEELMAVRGEGGFYHGNHIRAWKVERGGAVVFGQRDL